MSKKQGKSKGRFRHTKKNVLHKKRVNTKKRGLRGGMFKFFKTTRASADTAQSGVKFSNLVNPDDGTLHGMTGKFSTSAFLSDTNCTEYMDAIDNYQKSGNSIKLVPGSAGIRDYNQCLKVLKRVVTFDTSLTTKLKNQRLTLNGCKAIKKNIDQKNGHFKYEIFSPVATTASPNGGSQGETLVGTFTQLPVSYLLEMAGQKRPINFDSFYNTNEREPYFSDYISCLKNVKQQFGPEQETRSSQSRQFRPQESSKLRSFGKSEKCKIVLLAGNVGTQIQNPGNNGAIFVLPSQFNGAEYPSPIAITDLNEYKRDFTGGPLGQLSCHPAVATFILNYAARDGFTSDFLVINALAPNTPGGPDVMNTIDPHRPSLSPGLTLNNGYLEVKGSNGYGDFGSVSFEFYKDDRDGDGDGHGHGHGDGVLSEMAKCIFNSFCKNLKVLQTDDVPANGLTPPNEYSSFNFSAESKVSLVYASAVPLNYVYRLQSGKTTAINPEKTKLQYCVAGFDLVAQYFGAMVSAYNKSKKPEQVPGKKVKLFLTPVGGGVFNNPREMIACSALLAYYQAQQLFPDFDSKVQVIFLVWDGSEAECKDFIEFFNEDGSVERAIQELERKANEEREKTAAARKEMEEEQRAQGGVYPPNAPANTLRDNLTQFDSADDDASGVDQKSKEEEEVVSLPKRQPPEAAQAASNASGSNVRYDLGNKLPELGGGSKSRRRHRHHVRKTRRGRKSKSKPHKRQHNMRKRTRKHKKYTRKR